MELARKQGVLVVGSRKVELLTLQQGLRRLGVRGRRSRMASRAVMLSAMDGEERMWELLDEARSVWRRRLRREHPDKGGDAVKCAELNAVWGRVRELFRRRGYWHHR